MMFGMVVCQVMATFVPEDLELALRLPTFEPIEAHFKGFDAACDNGVVGVSLGSGVINLDWGAWLFSSHFI